MEHCDLILILLLLIILFIILIFILISILCRFEHWPPASPLGGTLFAYTLDFATSSQSHRIRDPVVITRFAQVKDDSAIDLVQSVLFAEVSHLLQQTLNFAFGIARQVVVSKDRWCRIGDRGDRNEIEIAPTGMKFAAAQRLHINRVGCEASVSSLGSGMG